MSKMTNLVVKDYKDMKDMEQNALREIIIIHIYIDQNHVEILRNLKPILEKIISKRILSISNAVVKYFT